MPCRWLTTLAARQALISACDATLTRLLVKLNAVSNTAHATGSAANPAAQLLEMMRSCAEIIRRDNLPREFAHSSGRPGG